MESVRVCRRKDEKGREEKLSAESHFLKVEGLFLWQIRYE